MGGKIYRKKVKVKCRTVGCRISGSVIVAKVKEEEEEQKNVMRNKSKLKSDKIFIENDLNWDERKIQERINRWAKEKRSKDR